MIELHGVAKTYRLRSGRKTVLNGASLTMPWRNTAILGRNGAGKSTFLRLISGIEEPDAGSIRRLRSLSWPIGFQGAFHRELSGLENVRFVSRIYGQNTEQIIDLVEDFAELGEFFFEPVKTYSSGMSARLAFGLSMAISFEVFLIDEVMSVGDARFQEKCRKAFADRLDQSRVLMVSHAMPALRDYCQSGVVLHNGRLTYFDDLEAAIERYRELNR